MKVDRRAPAELGCARSCTAALALILGLCASSQGCTSSPATKASPAGAAAKALPTASAPAPDDVSDGPVDLSITFDPRVSGENGWVKLPRPITLDMLGDAGASMLDVTADRIPLPPDDPMRGRLLEIMLGRAALADTSLIADEAALCSPALLAAIQKVRPRRLLLSFPGGITARMVSCLRALPTRRLYLAGCLYRSHRQNACDGDAEIDAITADDIVRQRVRGFAASPTLRAVRKLGKLPLLEYLALSPGRSDVSLPLFDLLPFDHLPHVRYLAAEGENADGEAMDGRAARFVGHLHTLRWNGRLTVPIPEPCQLERMSADVLRESDVVALAACTRLKELSSDTAEFDSAEPLVGFVELERLHLRHWKADNLALLAGLGKLRSLSLPASRARDWSFVASMRSLTDIDLSQTSLRSLAAFDKMTALECLDVDFTAVADLSPVRALTRLERLRLHETKVVDISVVAQLTSLKELSISSTAVTDLRPLARHPSLEWVILYESRVTDVSALFTMPALKRANIRSLALPKAQVEQLRRQLPGEVDD